MLSTCLLVAVSLFGQAQPGSIEGFLDELAAKRSTMDTLRIHFIMDNKSADSMTTDGGYLVYARPRRIVFHILDEAQEKDDIVYLVDKDKVYEHDIQLEQIRVFDRSTASDMQALFAAFEADSSELRRLYDISILEPSRAEDSDVDKIMELHLRLGENSAQEEKLFKSLRVYLRKDDWLPIRLEVDNLPESSVLFRFHQFEINPTLKDSDTQLAAPKDTVIIENDETVETVNRALKYLPDPVTTQETHPASRKSERPGYRR